MEFQLSNRFENISQTTHNMKLFAKAQVDINLSLGQLIKNTVFEEAEPEFQQYAFFKTRIGIEIFSHYLLIFLHKYITKTPQFFLSIA